jgi:hypothetical protein
MDTASWVVVAITFVLFGLAVVEKGLTHDLLLESGVFLVSLKLILMSAKMARVSEDTRARLDAIQASIAKLDPDRDAPGERPRPAH